MNFDQVLVRSILLCSAVSLAACSAKDGGSGSDAEENSSGDGSGGNGGTGTGGSGEGGEGDQGGSGGSGGDAGAGGTGGSTGGSSGTSGGAGGTSGGAGGTSDSTGGASGGSTGGTGGSTSSAGGSAGTSGGGGGSGGSGNGSVPEELVGVWQGVSVQLKIAADGAYYFAELTTGESSTCDAISYFEQSVGVAELDGNTLTLFPDEHRLDVTDCEESDSEVFANDPMPFTVSLEETRHYYGGLRTYRMHVEGGPVPRDLTLLHRPPPDDPVQPEQPSDFVLGEGSFDEFQGLWVADDGTDSDFFDPDTGEFYFPELNGSPHQWIRFYGDAYDTAVALQNFNAEGACKGDLIYYEQGLSRFQVTEDVGGQGNHFVGHGRLEATAARLIVNVRECEESDAVYEYDVEPLMSYYRFIYFSPDAPPERLSLDCAMFPQSEWLTMLCTNDVTSFYRRE